MYYNFLPQLYGFILTLRQLALILSQRRYHKLRKKNQQENLYFLCFICFTRTFFLLCALFSYLLET